MAGQGNAAPVIIKRKKIIKGGGHHGGAWKVAYADFVTAMMAFFMLMWLLNATTEKQRKGIADYFNPTIPVNRVSGGGDGAFGGDSTFTEETLAENGLGATANRATESNQARGATGNTPADEAAAAAEEKALAEVEQALSAKGGESMAMERVLRHIVTRITDEGLVIEIFDLEGAPLFAAETAEPTEMTREIATLLADVLAMATNDIAVNGHVRSYPVTLRTDPTWDLTTERAQSIRQLLEGKALPSTRIARITGHANRKPATADPTALRNNRIEITLLRKNI
jgi:chemotaxis protein MotB